MDRDDADNLWTYIGQNTFLLQIAPGRYLLRTRDYGTGPASSVNVRLMVLDHGEDILAYLKMKP